jgi:hypothetical protein
MYQNIGNVCDQALADFLVIGNPHDGGRNESAFLFKFQAQRVASQDEDVAAFIQWALRFPD